MNKIFRLLALLVLAQVSRSAAQTSEPSIRSGIKTSKNGPWEFNASLNPGISLYSSRFVIGTDLQLERYLFDKLALTFSAGFTYFSNKPYLYTFDHDPGSPALLLFKTDKNLIPLKLGIKVFPVKRIYIAGAAGIGVDINGNSSFLFSTTAGTKLGNRFDTGIKFENYTDFGKTKQLSLRLGYRIF